MLTKAEVKTIQQAGLGKQSALPRIFSALGDSNRWHIYTLLIEHENLCVTDLAHILDISVPAVSQHLRVMEMSGLVRRRRDGQMICYEIEHANMVSRYLVRIVKTVSRVES
jgi:ArsR family transcriptional regulator, lead/cadmium/zinc/bismuth-responsive transcriptional repressor